MPFVTLIWQPSRDLDGLDQSVSLGDCFAGREVGKYSRVREAKGKIQHIVLAQKRLHEVVQKRQRDGLAFSATLQRSLTSSSEGSSSLSYTSSSRIT